MLEVSNIDVYRGETQVLWDISLEVAAGERVAILGSNGAGKSSLMGAIAGILPSAGGKINFKGETISGRKAYEVTRFGIALVPEGRRVYKEMSVRENLEMGGYVSRKQRRIDQGMEQVFALFPVLRDRRHQAGGTLSGGEQQMLAIGRALMSRPELLLIDELSLGLAPRITKEIYQAIAGLELETTVLLVEQNVEMALSHSQRAYIMESGRITRSGRSETLMADDDIRRAYLGL